MALLVYSDKCKWSREIIEFIKGQPGLLEIVRFHNITTLGVPSKKITNVPTLVTDDGNMKVGGEVKAWLTSMIPSEFESWYGSDNFVSNIDGTDTPTLFELDRYGESLQPRLTPELEERIAMSVTDAFQKSRA
jgi:hypothetical protein